MKMRLAIMSSLFLFQLPLSQLNTFLVFFVVPSLFHLHQCDASKLPRLPIATVSRIYSNASAPLVGNEEQHLSPTSSSLTTLHVNWTKQEDVQVVKYLDSGRFSNVFEGVWWQSPSHQEALPVVIKVLKPTFMGKVRREIKMLELLRGAPHIVQLHGVLKNHGCHTVSLILDYMGKDTHWLSHRMSSLSRLEIQWYMYKLLQVWMTLTLPSL